MIEAQVGKPLGLSADQAAAAVIRIANDRMAGAIRMVSLARGHDPRDFALFAFGGAGPLHAVALARELGIPKVLIPARPGLTNALGCAVADVRHDFVRTVNAPLPESADDLVRRVLEEQIAEGRAIIEREGVSVERIDFVHRADMQFQGQSHILTVPLPGLDAPRDALHRLFEAAYWQRFQVELTEIRPVLVNLHTAVDRAAHARFRSRRWRRASRARPCARRRSSAAASGSAAAGPTPRCTGASGCRPARASTGPRSSSSSTAPP